LELWWVLRHEIGDKIPTTTPRSAELWRARRDLY
jgi:hypothetical protein